MSRVALITGVIGQDGACLAEFLLARACEVHGVKRRSSMIKTDRIDHLYSDPNDGDPKFRTHWQISGRSEIAFPERAKPGLEYVRTWSLLRDFWILIMTVHAVALKRGAH
jgi:hypothetical protein